ncbi:MAG: SDR family oxidoreductase [Hyphomicrobiaceae bacterium]
MDLGIKGKTALVLGASGGLGKAVAVALAREGANVAVAARSTDKLKDVAGSLAGSGSKAMPVTWDLSDLGAIDARIGAIEAQLGAIDILINNTGGPPPTTAAGQPLELWRSNFETMILSLIGTTDRVLPGMRERKWGRIVTITSTGVVAPIPGLAMSNALRSSLVGWSKTLAREVARDRVTANIVLPGRIATDRLKFFDAHKAKQEGKTPEAIAEASSALIPAGRYGTPEEFAEVVTFLAGTGASYVTGAVIRVDGGFVPSVY